MPVFGGPVRMCSGEAADLISLAPPEEDMARVRQALLDLAHQAEGSLRIYRARPCAAFAPRDLLLKDFAQAAEAMRSRGFAPVERRTGGQLAVYDESALVIDLVAPHPDPRPHVIERFAGFSRAIAAALQRFGIDARTGAVPGEYCPGDYSVNARGEVKLVGVAQRVNRHGYHLGAVIAVEPSPAVLEAVSRAYESLGLHFDPASFGVAAEAGQNVSFSALRDGLLRELRQLVDIQGLP